MYHADPILTATTDHCQVPSEHRDAEGEEAESDQLIATPSVSQHQAACQKHLSVCTWAQSAIYGDMTKGTGLLNNPLYIGQVIWNRSRWVKDPDTGKAKRLARPKQEWSRLRRRN